MLRKLALEVRRRFSWLPLSVQSNGLLLDKNRISFLRAVQAGLEVGIDGKEETTLRHRRGLTGSIYNRLLGNIRAAVRSGLSVSCTMTVHPDQVEHMEENFIFLKSLELRSIDITPAAFMLWTDASVRDFRRNYSQILQGQSGQGRVLVAEDKNLFGEAFLDLSVYPDGSVLCGDAYSCLPAGVKRARSLVLPSGQLEKKRLNFFVRQYASLWRSGSSCSYRDYVRRSFEIVDRLAGGALDAGRLNEMMRFIGGANLRLVSAERICPE
jgi:MoaA/NifB/PqqE/SkfB family radical SAM enzyme